MSKKHICKKGYRVKIKEDTPFYGQSMAIGTVLRTSSSNWATVLFDHNFQDNYPIEDLKIIEEKIKNWKETLAQT